MALNQDELVENFNYFEEWEDRYSYIIDLGKKLESMPDALKQEANKLNGCISQVWFSKEIYHDQIGGKRIHFLADSDAIIVRGLIGLLFEICQDRTPAEILAIPITETMTKIGLSSHLSMNRRNGFAAMIDHIKHTAQDNL